MIIQHFRTKQFREASTELGRMMAAAVDALDPGASARFGLAPPAEDEARLQALRFLGKSVQFAPMIESKAWILYEAPTTDPFWISDHPVVLNNTLEHSDISGSIGFAVPGIEIYLPISPRFCLGFMCPSIREQFFDAYSISLLSKHIEGNTLPTHDFLGAARDGFEYGYPLPFLPDNVEYVNWLEARWAERFVFSSHGNFDLVERMIAADPTTRHGPRPGIG